MEITVNGVRLFYTAAGQGSPLVLLHGNGESHAIFDRAVEALSRTHRVYTPDSRCHGRSEDPGEISYEAMAEDLRAFLHALEIRGAAVYGFSDGGIVGLLTAMEEPDLLGRLIVSGANLCPEGLRFRTRAAIRIQAARGKKLWQLMDREPHISPASLGRITVPTVVLAGQHDVVRRSHTELIAGSILRILPGESHSSYIVHSEKLAGILKDCL